MSDNTRHSFSNQMSLLDTKILLVPFIYGSWVIYASYVWCFGVFRTAYTCVLPRSLVSVSVSVTSVHKTYDFERVELQEGCLQRKSTPWRYIDPVTLGRTKGEKRESFPSLTTHAYKTESWYAATHLALFHCIVYIEQTQFHTFVWHACQMIPEEEKYISSSQKSAIKSIYQWVDFLLGKLIN